MDNKGDKKRVIKQLQKQIENCKIAISKLDLSNKDRRTKAWRDKDYFEKSIIANGLKILEILNKQTMDIVNKVVYNKKYNTIGVVLDSFDFGDVRTDADGVVYSGDLLVIKSWDHLERVRKSTNAQFAPSCEDRIKTQNLL